MEGSELWRLLIYSGVNIGNGAEKRREDNVEVNECILQIHYFQLLGSDHQCFSLISSAQPNRKTLARTFQTTSLSQRNKKNIRVKAGALVTAIVDKLSKRCTPPLKTYPQTMDIKIVT